MPATKSLTVFLIKPSKYDDNGFVIRYVRGVLPSNTLACMLSLTETVAERWRVNGGTRIRTEIIDDVVQRIPYDRIARMNRGNQKAVAALVGVQTNQFPRAADIAMRLARAGVTTLIGGFHVSGVLSVFGEPTQEIQELIDAGVTVVQGEAEETWEGILTDAADGSIRPLYRTPELPDITSSPIPVMPKRYLKRFALKRMATIDCSRGCPFNCSFCTIINVQGKKMRCRSAESVLATIRANYPGITEYFFTDDNFSRNPTWEEVFDGLIAMREQEGMKLEFMIQVDTRCHTIPGFIEKASRAGCTQAFIGMESINPKNLEAVEKKQNNVNDYATFIQAWHDAGVMTHVGYIIGFPFDTVESVRRDVERLKNEIKVDQASFFILTPLPGSRDHEALVRRGDPMDPDLNRFDSFHVVQNHGGMSAEECYSAYQSAWESFYETANLKNVLMRAGRKPYWGVFKNIMWYKNSLLEPNHPMITGFIRLKDRTDVRSGVPVMPWWRYYPIRLAEMISGMLRRVGLYFELHELWLLTRKPDDPKFKLVADISETIGEAKTRLASINLTSYPAKWSEEAGTVANALAAKIREYRSLVVFRGRARKRVTTLLEDMATTLDNLPAARDDDRTTTAVSSYLSRCISQIEEYANRQVARRRRITGFWNESWQRLKRGRVVTLTLSLPRITFSAIRDFRMSISFAYHFVTRSF